MLIPDPRIRILIFYPSRIPDTWVKKAQDPRIRIRNTECEYKYTNRYQYNDEYLLSFLTETHSFYFYSLNNCVMKTYTYFGPPIQLAKTN
jgi:hypothetical protein